MSASCPFCAIAAERMHAGEYRRYGDGRFAVYQLEPLNPVTDGHLLFVPARHVVDAGEDPEVTAAVYAAAATYLYDHPDLQANLITSRGPAATQTVRHLHVHVVPRREGDGLHLPWTGQATMPDQTPCPHHKPVQHRDMQPPWCNLCGRTAAGQLVGRPKASQPDDDARRDHQEAK